MSYPATEISQIAKASGDVAAALGLLPLDKLFGAPFDAAYQAQSELAMSTAFFIKRFGLDGSNNFLEYTASSSYDVPAANLLDACGNTVYYLWKKVPGGASDTNNITINPPGINEGATIRKGPSDTSWNPGTGLNTGVDSSWNAYALNITGGGTIDISGVDITFDSTGRIVGSQGERSITLPFISLLNVPTLSITEVNVDFIIEIKTQQNRSATKDMVGTEVKENVTSGSYRNWFSGGNWANSQVVSQCAIGNKKQTTDDTQTTCTYQVHMSAIDQQPVGMKMLLDFLTVNKDNSSPMELATDGYSLKPKVNSDGFFQFGYRV